MDNSRTATESTTETIAFLLDYAPQTWCSREDYHVRLSQALKAKGVRSLLVFAKELPEELASLFRQKGVEYTAIDYGKGFRHYFKELGKVIRKYSVNAVHICYFDYFSAIAWMCRLYGVQTIIYEAVNSGVMRATSWKKFLLRLRTRVMTKPLTRVIAISDYVQLQLVTSGLNAEKIDVRHLGVDHERFVPRSDARTILRKEFGINPDEVIITTVSFLNPFKNPQTIIEACGRLAEQKLQFRLLVAGDGVLRKDLEALTCKLGIKDRVKWLGHFADPRWLLQGSDIFALASVGEAFGLVLPEAMACGLPVVATRSGGIVEIVEDQMTGLLVAPLDSEAFARALRQLIENDELRKTLGAQGLKRVADKFTVDRVVTNTLKIYESIKSGERSTKYHELNTNKTLPGRDQCSMRGV